MEIVALRNRLGMALTPLTALSPVDGRYASKLGALRAGFSEAGLIAQRVRIEAAWLIYLSETARIPQLQALAAPTREVLKRLAASPPADAPESVKKIEQRINHDVKAVEYYVREQLAAAGATAATLEFVHFACTSEDINNL